MGNKIISDVGRVTLFPLLHTWPDRYGVAAYATTGHFGITAVLGYIPIPEVSDMSFLDIAARHSPGGREAHASWALCTAWSARTVLKPGSLDVPDARWELEIESTATPAGVIYGHRQVHTGRFRFLSDETVTEENGVVRILDDEVRMKQARELLPHLQAG
ncbi:hypothetical protein ACIQUL_36030 [Streptomyces sp. NPDC090303]|uniref:hypothetical protein n=1 Tax=Streptomyces sp. NPDC090303 TaxID=3365960 RepID=UPI0038168F0B